MMKLWKLAALVALATIPVLLINGGRKKSEKPAMSEPDNIFESELTVE